MFRLGQLVAGLVTIVAALGFYEEARWATDLWPWPDSRLSFIFIASILAAIALPVLWISITGELAAVRAGAADLALTYGATAIYLATLAGDPGQPELGPYIAVFGVSCLVMVAMLGWSRRIAWVDQRPMPGPVRASFALLALALIGTGTALVFGAEIFPWNLRSESSVIFGFIYLGAAAYFVYGLLEPRWANAAGQLIGFLAYDLVLIGPFIDRFDEVSDGQLVSLIIYTAAVVYSGALAVYYLFVNEGTRIQTRAGSSPAIT
jgi:hypothetical protein